MKQREITTVKHTESHENVPEGTSGDPEPVLSSAHSKTCQVTDKDGDPLASLGNVPIWSLVEKLRLQLPYQDPHSLHKSCSFQELQGGAAYQGQMLAFIFFKLHGRLVLPSL